MKINFFDRKAIQQKAPVKDCPANWGRNWTGYFYPLCVRSVVHSERAQKTHAVSSTVDCFDESCFEDFCTLSILQEIKKPDINFFELGAGWGSQSLDIAGIIDNKLLDIVPQKILCYAIEAEPTHFQWLQNTFNYNRIAGYTFFGAMTEIPGWVNFITDVNPADSYGQSIKDSGQTKIPSYSLDYLMDILKVDHADIVHMDVQGEEYKVLLGSKKHIEAGMIDYLIVCTHKTELEKEICDFLGGFYDLVIGCGCFTGMNNVGLSKPANIPQDGLFLFQRKNLR